ncbi:MAG: hypothetical protein MZV70_61000 [Desulfobacterales bacterium]|nr:hypothetical protein [Desulfobacterales bacterium]
MFMSLIRKRRSIRQFQTTAVEKEKVDLIGRGRPALPVLEGEHPMAFRRDHRPGHAGAAFPG